MTYEDRIIAVFRSDDHNKSDHCMAILRSAVANMRQRCAEVAHRNVIASSFEVVTDAEEDVQMILALPIDPEEMAYVGPVRLTENVE